MRYVYSFVCGVAVFVMCMALAELLFKDKTGDGAGPLVEAAQAEAVPMMGPVTMRAPIQESVFDAPAEPVAVVEPPEDEMFRLRARLRYLETQAALLDGGQIGRWAASVNPEQIPDARTRGLMAEYLRDYPVELQPYEGLWLAERIAANDWHQWGPTIDEALITYLGASRILAACTPEQAVALRQEWMEEGYFQ